MSQYCEQKSKAIKSFIFSEMFRPNIGLIDPGFLSLVDLMGSSDAIEHPPISRVWQKCFIIDFNGGFCQQKFDISRYMYHGLYLKRLALPELASING